MSATGTGLRLQGHTLCVPVSFETGEQVDFKVPFSGRVLINRVKAVVVKALAGTDDGNIAIKNSAGTTTYCTLNLPLSSALGVVASCAGGNAIKSGDATFAPETVIVPDKDTLLVSGVKSTVGGKVLLFIEYQPCPK